MRSCEWKEKLTCPSVLLSWSLSLSDISFQALSMNFFNFPGVQKCETIKIDHKICTP